MTAKEYLGQIRQYEYAIDCKLAEAYRLRALAENISANIGGERVMSSPRGDKLAKTVEKIFTVEEEARKLATEYTKRREQIIADIEKIRLIDDKNANDYYNVLFRRFVLCEPFSEIAEKLYMSERKMYYTYNGALIAFKKIMDAR